MTEEATPKTEQQIEAEKSQVLLGLTLQIIGLARQTADLRIQAIADTAWQQVSTDAATLQNFMLMQQQHAAALQASINEAQQQQSSFPTFQMPDTSGSDAMNKAWQQILQRKMEAIANPAPKTDPAQILKSILGAQNDNDVGAEGRQTDGGVGDAPSESAASTSGAVPA